jgi:hypothetical protein
MNVEILNDSAQAHFWEYINWIYFAVQCKNICMQGQGFSTDIILELSKPGSSQTQHCQGTSTLNFIKQTTVSRSISIPKALLYLIPPGPPS